LNGGGGADHLTGGPDQDDDTINARDGSEDTIDCGPGNDTVLVDTQEDGVFDCENVIYPPPDGGG
jgi:Ca2+-binding RTX toxin-like protein